MRTDFFLTARIKSPPLFWWPSLTCCWTSCTGRTSTISTTICHFQRKETHPGVFFEKNLGQGEAQHPPGKIMEMFIPASPEFSATKWLVKSESYENDLISGSRKNWWNQIYWVGLNIFLPFIHLCLNSQLPPPITAVLFSRSRVATSELLAWFRWWVRNSSEKKVR